MVFLTPSNYLLPCHLSLDDTGLWTLSSLLHEFGKASLWEGLSKGSQARKASLPQRAIKHRLLVNHNHCVICKCVYHTLWLAAATEKSLGSPLLTAAGRVLTQQDSLWSAKTSKSRGRPTTQLNSSVSSYSDHNLWQLASTRRPLLMRLYFQETRTRQQKLQILI